MTANGQSRLMLHRCPVDNYHPTQLNSESRSQLVLATASYFILFPTHYIKQWAAIQHWWVQCGISQGTLQ